MIDIEEEIKRIKLLEESNTTRFEDEVNSIKEKLNDIEAINNLKQVFNQLLSQQIQFLRLEFDGKLGEYEIKYSALQKKKHRTQRRNKKIKS